MSSGRSHARPAPTGAVRNRRTHAGKEIETMTEERHETTIRLAIVGTRVLACAGDRDRAAGRIEWSIRRLRPDVVISGGAAGIDTLAADVAGTLGYTEAAGTLVIYAPRVRRFHGPGGYRERDQIIAEQCTHLLRLACWKATTYGSGWTADHAESIGRHVVRHALCGTPGDRVSHGVRPAASTPTRSIVPPPA